MALKRILIILSVIVLILLISTAVYMLLEGWSLPDALYMTTNVLTTIGIKEPRPLSVQGIIFTVVFSLLSFFTLAIVISFLSSTILEQSVFGNRRKRIMLKKIARMKHHYIICGAGKIGKYVINTFFELKKPFVIIDSDEKLIQNLVDENPQVREILSIVGDATNEDILVQSAVSQAKGLITCMPEDSQNLFIALSAKKLNPEIQISSYISDENNISKFHHVGVEEIVPGDFVLGRRLAVSLLNKNISMFLEQTNTMGKDASFYVGDVILDKKSPYLGKPLSESGIYHNCGLLIFAIKPALSEQYNFNPNPSIPLQEGDTLITFGSQDDITLLHNYVNKGQVPAK